MDKVRFSPFFSSTVQSNVRPNQGKGTNVSIRLECDTPCPAPLSPLVTASSDSFCREIIKLQGTLSETVEDNLREELFPFYVVIIMLSIIYL